MAKQLPQPRRISQHGLRQRGIQGQQQRKILGLRLSQCCADSGVQHFPHAELALVERELAGFERGVLQRGVQDFEQVLRAQARGGHVLTLLLVQIGFEQQIRHPDDSGQRRADFVVQAGEEGSLEMLDFLVGGRRNRHIVLQL